VNCSQQTKKSKQRCANAEKQWRNVFPNAQCKGSTGRMLSVIEHPKFPRLTACEMRVLFVLLARADFRTGQVILGYSTIAAAAGCAKRSAIRSIAQLDRAGMLRIVRGGGYMSSGGKKVGRANAYIVAPDYAEKGVTGVSPKGGKGVTHLSPRGDEAVTERREGGDKAVTAEKEEYEGSYENEPIMRKDENETAVPSATAKSGKNPFVSQGRWIGEADEMRRDDRQEDHWLAWTESDLPGVTDLLMGGMNDKRIAEKWVRQALKHTSSECLEAYVQDACRSAERPHVDDAGRYLNKCLRRFARVAQEYPLWTCVTGKATRSAGDVMQQVEGVVVKHTKHPGDSYPCLQVKSHGQRFFMRTADAARVGE